MKKTINFHLILTMGLMLNVILSSAQRELRSYQSITSDQEEIIPLLLSSDEADPTPGGYILNPDRNAVKDFDPALAGSLQQVLESIRNKNNLLGMSAAAYVPGAGMWLGVSGYSTLEPLDTITPDMLFNIVTMDVSFESVLLLLMAEEGTITLEDSIGTYLSGLPETVSGQITIRQLLNHTAGLWDYINHSAPDLKDTLFSAPDHYWTFEEIMDVFMGPPSFEPGTSCEDSHTNYLVATELIRQITDTTVSGILHKRLLDPLQLEHTFFPPEEQLVEPIAHPWGMLHSSDPEPGDTWDLWSSTAWLSYLAGPGSMFSTAEDMTKFVYTLLSGDLVSQSSLDQIENYSFPWGPSLGLGMGLYWERDLGKVAVGYSGWYWDPQGYSATTYYIPSTGFTFSLFSNDRSLIFLSAPLFINEYLKSLSINSTTQSDKVYLLASNDNGVLYTFLPADSSINVRGPVLYDSPLMLKINPATGDLWGLANPAGIGIQVIRFNTSTGEAFPKFDITLPETEYLRGMAFNPEGELIICGSLGNFYRVDTKTGEGTFLTNTPIATRGLAIQPDNGTWWVSAKVGSPSHSRIFTIDSNSGDTTGIGNIEFEGSILDLAFDSENNLIAIPANDPSGLYMINQSTGKASLIASLDTLEMISLTFGSEASVPVSYEPYKRNDTGKDIMCYPNPATNRLTIEIEGNTSPAFSIELFDISGKAIYFAKNKSGEAIHSIDLSDLAEGIYFVRIRNEEFCLTKKIIKVK